MITKSCTTRYKGRRQCGPLNLISSADAIKVLDWVLKYVHKNDVITVNVLAVGQGYATRNLSSEAVAWLKRNLKRRLPVATGPKNRLR